MAYNVVYKDSVRRDLKRLDKSIARRVIDKLEEDLTINPEAHPVLQGRFAGLRKYRVGDYRVIYTLLAQDVLVLHIAHRKEVYRLR